MQIARVIGNVVSTSKSEKLDGLKLLIVKPIDLDTFQEKGAPIVSIDTVGAGEGEIVMIVSGSSSRQTTLTDGKPADNAIIAIIDHIDIHHKRIFTKDGIQVTSSHSFEEWNGVLISETSNSNHSHFISAARSTYIFRVSI